MATAPQIVKIAKKVVAFPQVCPHCLEPASASIAIRSEEKLVANYIFLTRWKHSYFYVPFCAKIARRKRKASIVCMVAAFGLLAVYILVTLLTMRTVDGSEGAIVFLIFLGLFWVPPLLVRPGKYIRLLTVDDGCVQFEISDARYAKMLAILNGAASCDQPVQKAMKETEALTDQERQSWLRVAIAGATIFQRLQESLNLFPTREQWEYEFQKQTGSGIDPLSPRVMDALWDDSDAAGRKLDRLAGKWPMADVVKQAINWERVKAVVRLEQANPAPQPKEPTPATTAAVSSKPQPRKQVFMSKKKILIVAATLFVLTSIVPPWQYTEDRNGESGFHSKKPAGYSLILAPPEPERGSFRSEYYGVQIDFGRLFLEWAVLAVATGIVWVLIVKPTWTRDEKTISGEKFIAPTGNPKN